MRRKNESAGLNKCIPLCQSQRDLPYHQVRARVHGDLRKHAPVDLLFFAACLLQSSNFIRVRHQGDDDHWWRHWYLEDWFHVLLRVRTWVALLLLVICWTTVLLIFAAVYMWVDRLAPDVNCGLSNPDDGKTIHFQGAFAFSLETSTTVGYGLPNGTNGFFENCVELQVAIYFQMLTSMTFNAFLLSFVFASVSRSQTRGAQVRLCYPYGHLDRKIGSQRPLLFGFTGDLQQ